MRPRIRLVELPAHDSKPPHKCIVTARRDGPLVDFGKDYVGRDPHIYLRKELVERAATEVLEMVPRDEVNDLRAELEEANAEAGRLRAIVAGGEELSVAEDRLREALGPAPTTEGTE